MHKFALTISLFMLGTFSALADNQYDACIDKYSSGNYAEWQNCGIDYLERLDSELNRVWKIINRQFARNDKISKQARQQLLEEQRIWLDYRDHSCLPFQGDFYKRSGQALYYYMCRADIVDHRINDLKSYCVVDLAPCKGM